MKYFFEWQIIVRKINYKISFFSRFFLCLFTLAAIKSLSSTALSPAELHAEFAASPKFAVHLGFSSGLPKDGIIDSCYNIGSSSYGATFFSVNCPFPYTEYMGLHTCPYAVIVPIDAPFLKNVISFHPTELVRIGDFRINKDCIVIAPDDAVVPEYYTNMGIVDRYRKQKKTTDNRDSAVRFAISKKGGIPLKLKLERDFTGKLTWHNDTPAVITCTNGADDGLNVNFRDNFPDVFNKRNTLSYSCPAQGIGGLGSYGRIKVASSIKHSKVEEDFTDLNQYLLNLGHVDQSDIFKFGNDLRTMLKPSICDQFNNNFKRKVKPNLKKIFWSGVCILTIAAYYWGWI